MKFWTKLKRPLCEPTSAQRVCGSDSVGHTWLGQWPTNRFHCSACRWYPYRDPEPKDIEGDEDHISASVSLVPMPPLISTPPQWITSPSINIQMKTEKPAAVDLVRLSALKDAEPYKVTHRVPDYISVIPAWRAWGVIAGGDGYRLKSLGIDHVWEPKQALAAECSPSSGIIWFTAGVTNSRSIIKPTRQTHCAPQENCSCGVWAFKELDALVEAVKSYDKIRVLGQVSLWGRVVETVNGYRAQYAYPSELWLLDPSLEELGLIYDVPVRCVR